MDMNVISFYGSHDSSICLVSNGEYRIFELEKFAGKRNCSFSKNILFNPSASPCEYTLYLEYVKKHLDSFTIDVLIQNQVFDNDLVSIRKMFDVKKVVKFDHHLSHAATAFYQSPYEVALVVTFDGGGEDIDGCPSYFNFYICDRTEIRLVKKMNVDICGPYANIAVPIKEINKSPNILSYPGKLMGLSSYGNYNTKLFVPLYNFLKTYNFEKLKVESNIDFRCPDIIDGMLSQDLAYMAQYSFQKVFEEIFVPVWEQYSSLPVCFSGGGALNVINNQAMYKKLGGKLFIPPNPNDCGLAFGALAHFHNPKSQLHVVYNGYDIVKDCDYNGVAINTNELCQKLLGGMIVGVLRNRSEVGPRALGNRSILCDPSIKGIRDTLNKNIKFREWFRPFAPVVREIDLSKYFEHTTPVKFMELCVKIKEKYKSVLSEVVHVDGTCRVQTITHDSNSFLYSILSSMEIHGKIPILLNTSFNMKGRPLIQKVSDALHMLNNTVLDGIVIEDKYIGRL